MNYYKYLKYFSAAFFIAAMFLFSGFRPYADSIVRFDKKSTEGILRLIADNIIKSSSFEFIDKKSGSRYISVLNAPPNAVLTMESPYNDWRYWNGVLNIAMIKLGKVLNKASYSDFAVKNIRFDFENYKYFRDRYLGEDKWTYPFAQQFITEELDDYGAMSASLIEVYQINKNSSYKNYIDLIAEHILKNQYRYTDGSFIRSFPHKWTLWADDLYMSISFLSRMGELSGDTSYYNDAARQIINYNKYLFDNRKELMYHNWCSEKSKNGVAFWGRANGWALLAQVDLIERLPQNNPLRDTILTLFKRHISGVMKYQSNSGLWHQLLDKEDSYLETSCSAMFVYVIARAINKGFLKQKYAIFARRGWQGLLTKITSKGQIEGICAGTVVSYDLTYYYKRPTPLNDVHGLGPVLLAGTEIIQL